MRYINQLITDHLPCFILAPAACAYMRHALRFMAALHRTSMHCDQEAWAIMDSWLADRCDLGRQVPVRYINQLIMDHLPCFDLAATACTYMRVAMHKMAALH